MYPGERYGIRTDKTFLAHRMAENNDVKMENHDLKFPITNVRTPRNIQDLGLTPSWMESASYSMMPLVNQHSGFYTPTSSGMGAVFHNQAGDLHTPTGMHLMTPLAGMPAIQNHHSNGFEPFHPQFINPVHGMNQYTQQPSYAPSAFMHRDTGYDAMDDTLDDSALNDVNAETASNVTASTEFSAQIGGDMSYAKGEQ